MGPVRGQARVVGTTIGHRPRGQASVVVNLEPTGEPEPPNLPVQHLPAQHLPAQHLPVQHLPAQRGAADDVVEDQAVWEDDPSTDEALVDAKPRDDD
jgi:hypothetical protein